MITGRFQQAVVGLSIVSSVSVVGAALSGSRFQGTVRARQAVQVEAPQDAGGAFAAPGGEVPNVGGAAPLIQEDTGALERQLRTYRIRQSADGAISGRIAVADPATGMARSLHNVVVSFLSNGRVIATAHPGADGVFRANVAPGIYAVTAAGPAGYAAFGVQIIGEGAEVRSASFQEVADTLQIETLAIPAQDIPTVYRLAHGQIPAEVIAQGATPPAAEETLPGNGPGGIGEAADTAIKHQAVRIQADGSIVGRMRRLHPQSGEPMRVRRLNVFLVRDGGVVSQAAVTEAGFFRFQNVLPGTYSFVSAGSDGFAAFSVVAEGQNVASNDAADSLIVPVAYQAELLDLVAGLVGPENLQQVLQDLYNLAVSQGYQGPPPNQPVPPEFGPGPGAGGGGTGGGGGGFGGGGGGGLGALGLLGAGAAGAAIGWGISEANDDDHRPRPPVSPVSE